MERIFLKAPSYKQEWVFIKMTQVGKGEWAVDL